MQILSETFGERFQFGELQSQKQLTVLPFTSDLPAGPDYLTLDEALSAGTLHITEISEGGSVPQLAVVNNGDQPVLLLDGEELVGAKQNRVVNTSILLSPHSKTVIPVSCVEMGRWNYTSKEFHANDHVMPADIRACKMNAVTQHLSMHGMRVSDQSAVWHEVHCLAKEFDAPSATHAMQDVYVHVKTDVDALIKCFEPIAEQRGFAMFINGHLTGIEFLSNTRVFAHVYPKLLRSYAVMALRRRNEEPIKVDVEQARRALASVPTARMQTYPAIGLGHEHRIDTMQVNGGAERLQGVALTLDDTLVHLALLPVASRRRKRFTDLVDDVIID